MKFHGPVMHAEFSLDNFRTLFARSPRPLFNTLYLATGAALLAAAIGVPVGYAITRYRSKLSHLLDVVAMAPFAVAGTEPGIGLVIAFNSGWLLLTGGLPLLVLAHAVRTLPFNVQVGREPCQDRAGESM